MEQHVAQVAVLAGKGEQEMVAAKSVCEGVGVGGAVALDWQGTQVPVQGQLKGAVLVASSPKGFNQLLSLLPKAEEAFPISLVCLHTGGGKGALEEASAQAVKLGFKVAYTLSLERHGAFRALGFATALSESDLARAKAIGERTAYVANDDSRHKKPPGEKARIPGYRK